MLSRGALTVVAAADDDSLSCLLAVLGKVLVALLEAEVRQERYVRAVGENLCARGHDVVGCDVVADFENNFCLDALGQCVAVGNGLDVRAVDYLKIFRFLGRSGLVDEIVVYFKVVGHCDVRRLAEGSRVCQHARESGGRSDLGADEIDAGVRRAGASLEVAVEGTQGDSARVRRLTHAYARTARALKQSCARAEDVGECAVLGEHSENLHRAGGDSEADTRGDALALEDSRHLEHIVERGVRTGADADLVDLYLAYF